MELLNNGYTNHLHPSATHPVTGEVFIAYNETVPGPNRKNLRNVKIIRRTLDGKRTLVKEYRENEGSVTGPLGYTAVTLLPNGDLLVTLSLGAVEGDETVVRAALDIIPGVAQPWPLTSSTTLPVGPASLRLRNPNGWRNYGGVGKQHQFSADGYVYFYACGWRNDVFGMYVMKQTISGNEPAVFVDYAGPVMSGRGDMYLTGNGELYVSGHTSDKDVTPRAEKVPGFKPLVNVVTHIGGGSSTGGSADTSALEARIAGLERQLAAAQSQAKAALDRANYVKSVFDPVWGRLDALDRRPVGISRDEAWQLAADRAYVEVTTEGSGVRNAIKSLVQPAKPADLTALEARVEAVAGQVAGKVDGATAEAITKRVLAEWWDTSKRYINRELLNLMWDRGVKLARYLKVPGADKAPINDQKNLEV